MITTITLFGMTDVGEVRDHNEDDFGIARDVAAGDWSFRRGERVPLGASGSLLVVADGMGGTNAGEVASDLAQRSVQGYFANEANLPSTREGREEFLRGAILHAHEAIVEHQHANLDTAGMGTTLVVAWIVESSLHVAWSGDSRCYLLHPGDFDLPFPFTDDHSVVWNLVVEGELTPEEARVHDQSNFITQSLGDPANPPRPSSRSALLFQGSRVMVCSDGLNGMIPDPQIRQLMAQDLEISDIARQMVQIAKEAGGHDNITCLMAEVVEGPARAVSAAHEGEGEVGPPTHTPSTDSPPTSPPSSSRKRRWGTYALVAFVAAFAGAFGPRLFDRAPASTGEADPDPPKAVPIDKGTPEDGEPSPSPLPEFDTPPVLLPDSPQTTREVDPSPADTLRPEPVVVPDTLTPPDTVIRPDTLTFPLFRSAP